MTKKGKISKMQIKIYDYIADTIRRQGYPPSVREIGEALNLKSPSTVHFHLKKMRDNGLISIGAGKGRAIALQNEPEGAKPVPAPELKPRFTEPEIPIGKVPVVGNVAAGTPILAQELIEDYLPFDTGGRDGEFFALRIRGESMIGAGILPGDLVVVHQQEDALSSEIVVAMLEEEATVKRLLRKRGETWLMPENPAYKPIDGRYATILGKVVAVYRTY